jgi:hypothetical protein
MTTAAPQTPVAELPATVAPATVPATSVPATAGGFSITALVLGIAGIALGQGLLSIAAIVFGFVARNKEPQSRIMANWGLVLGLVGVFGGILLSIVGVLAFVPFAAGFGGLTWGF